MRRGWATSPPTACSSVGPAATGSYRRASTARAPARLNDGTYVPYLPAYVGSDDFDRSVGWYAAVVDGPLQAALYTGLLAGEPEEGWLLDFLNDGFYLLSPGLADEPFFAGQLNAYARRDEPEMLIYAFYSLLANGADRQTLTTYEHRSWGSGRVFDLIHWAAGNWDMGLWTILCRTEGKALRLCPAAPRRWLRDGERIVVDRLQTELGPVSFEVRSRAAVGLIEATVSPPARGGCEEVILRLRHPTRARLLGATVDGEEWSALDPAREEIRLPARGAGPRRVVARY
ncbi:MAG: hypothetical protein HY721_25320 [Planctomycetes bacterium]|nr:hypothetical protein [Planctomycetota bacterium]